jgi:hypothetical protein
MSTRNITDELVAEVVDDLRSRYALDDDDVRALGTRLSESVGERRAANRMFAERFMAEHSGTFERLSK